MAHIDTLKYYEELVKGGSTEAEAKAHIYNLGNAISDLATKEDLRVGLAMTKEDLRSGLAAAKEDLHREISGLEKRIDSKFTVLENNINAKFSTIRTLGWALFGGVMLPIIKSEILPLLFKIH